MKKILLFGAGKSATCLIDYLGKICSANNWNLIVADADLNLADAKTKTYPAATAISFDVSDTIMRQQYIAQSDLVISMLPPSMHIIVANDCLLFAKHLLTASYLDSQIKSLDEQIKEKEILFLGEMGLDPGIDHMSAMKMIHEINSHGGKIISFRSHCGGLVAPESDDNPWHYKITWNPANVVMAGSAGAEYLKEGKMLTVPYKRIFSDDQLVDIPSLGKLAWYPNRDSNSYISLYKLFDAKTFIRTTLRYPQFCEGWNKIVQLGLTRQDDREEIGACRSIADWFQKKSERFLEKNRIGKDEFFSADFKEQIHFLGLDAADKIPANATSSAALLQLLLEKNLVLKPADKDMIVMMHEITYVSGGKQKHRRSTLVVLGEDAAHTAMAKTVGLPLGIAARLVLEGKIKLTGAHIPLLPEIYEPVLKELAANDITFLEEEEEEETEH